jgi:hypothetical protein
MHIKPEVSCVTAVPQCLHSLKDLLALHYYLHSCPSVDCQCFQHNASRGNAAPMYSRWTLSPRCPASLQCLDSLEDLLALHYYLHSCPNVDFQCFQDNAGRGNLTPKYSRWTSSPRCLVSLQCLGASIVSKICWHCTIICILALVQIFDVFKIMPAEAMPPLSILNGH